MMGPDDMGFGSGGMGMAGSSATLVAMSPAMGADGVSTTASMMLRFSGPMAWDMERYVDLHQGNLSGPTVPMSCSLSPDRTQIACTPLSPLHASTTYTLHVGAGMLDATGHSVDMSGFGGQWIMGSGGVMTSSHGGAPWGMMAGSWMGPNGAYGMAYTFTTA